MTTGERIKALRPQKFSEFPLFGCSRSITTVRKKQKPRRGGPSTPTGPSNRQQNGSELEEPRKKAPDASHRARRELFGNSDKFTDELFPKWKQSL